MPPSPLDPARSGGIGLGRIFRSASTSGGTRVAAADFGDVMGHWGCSLAPQEARAVVAHLSRDGGRTIDYEDLLTKVKVRAGADPPTPLVWPFH